MFLASASLRAAPAILRIRMVRKASRGPVFALKKSLAKWSLDFVLVSSLVHGLSGAGSTTISTVCLPLSQKRSRLDERIGPLTSGELHLLGVPEKLVLARAHSDYTEEDHFREWSGVETMTASMSFSISSSMTRKSR